MWASTEKLQVVVFEFLTNSLTAEAHICSCSLKKTQQYGQDGALIL